MEISGISGVNPGNSGQPDNGVAIQAQKKAMELQKQTAAGLLEALPQPTENLGNNINIKV